MSTPQQVLDKMLANDAFSKLLGLVVDEIKSGYCKLHFTITPEMLNGFNVLHGGVTYSAADSAFAFASNSYNRLSLALTTTMDYFETGKVGDTLVVEATEESLRHKTSVYLVRITNQDNKLIALFKGTGYRTDKPLVNDV